MTAQIENMTQFQLRNFAEENSGNTLVTLYVTPEEAAILLLANRGRQGIGVSKVNKLVMMTLRRLKFIENTGAKAGRFAAHHFTPRANTNLRFRLLIFDEEWISVEIGDQLNVPMWRRDLEEIAGAQAEIALKAWQADWADWRSRRRR